MKHQRFIAPLLPIAVCLITGIIVGSYLSICAEILLAMMAISIILILLLNRFPNGQTFFIYLTTLMMGCWLIQHPLPNISIVHAAIAHMLSHRMRLIAELQNLPDVPFAIISAMTLGDKSALSSATREVFNTTGAGHILALSGLHLGIYNPQNEMFARFQTKRSIQQNEMSSQLPRKSLFSSLT